MACAIGCWISPSAGWGLGLDFYDGTDLGTLERIVRPGKTRLV